MAESLAARATIPGKDRTWKEHMQENENKFLQFATSMPSVLSLMVSSLKTAPTQLSSTPVLGAESVKITARNQRINKQKLTAGQ